MRGSIFLLSTDLIERNWRFGSLEAYSFCDCSYFTNCKREQLPRGNLVRHTSETSKNTSSIPRSDAATGPEGALGSSSDNRFSATQPFLDAQTLVLSG